MRVRSFEITGAGDRDLRNLHDHLMETGGFEFQAGGSGFFVVVGQRFAAAKGAAFAQVVIASREDDTINVDAIVAGGGDDPAGQLSDVQRATDLVRGFATRNALTVTDI